MKRIIALLLLALSIFLLSGCKNYTKYDSSGRRVCGHCGGAGYVRNGATNAQEYALMKKECPICHGKGYLNN